MKQEKERLTETYQQDIKRLTDEHDRLFHANDASNERMTRQNDVHQQEVERLSHATKQSEERVSRASAALEQRVERLEAVNSQQTALNPNPEPDTRSQFTVFACTYDNVTMSCPNDCTILTTSTVYGRFVLPCEDCCAPNPAVDCDIL